MTSATASSMRSASCVESSAAMISESDVERNGDALLAQLGVQLDGVDQVAVVGERDLAPVGAPDRLRVLPRVGAGGRVADVADRHVALAARAACCSSKTWLTRPWSRMAMMWPSLGRGDPRGLLAAVLERVEREVGEPGDVVSGRVDAEHTALVARAVAMVEFVGHEDKSTVGTVPLRGSADVPQATSVTGISLPVIGRCLRGLFGLVCRGPGVRGRVTAVPGATIGSRLQSPWRTAPFRPIAPSSWADRARPRTPRRGSPLPPP